MSREDGKSNDTASVPALVDALEVLGLLIASTPPDSVDTLSISVAEAVRRHRDFDACEVAIATDAIAATGSESASRHGVDMPAGLDRLLAAEVYTITADNGLVYTESKLHRRADDLSGSLIGVPIMRGTHPIGAVIAWSAEPDSLMPWHQRLLTMVANLVRLLLAGFTVGHHRDHALGDARASIGVLPRTRADDPASVVSGRAGVDALTGLPDRAAFEIHLQGLLAQTTRTSVVPFLLHIDIDRFRVVREFGGDLTAERLIRTFSELLRREMGGELLIGRLGMDQFGVALARGSLKEAIAAAEALVETVDALRLSFSGQRYDVSISIGLASLQTGPIGVVMAMRQALQACRAVQMHGGGAVQAYNRGFLRPALVPDDGRLLNLLTQALKEDALLLYAQPIAARAGPAGAPETFQMHEILLRLRNTNGVLLGADELLPLAERYGLSAKLDRWVIKRAFAQIANSSLAQDPRHCFTLNLSGHSIDDHRLFDYITDQFALSGLPPQRICFEITETVAISDIGGASEFVDALRNIGCTFALDDFGSGRSSFLYLRELSVDYLKIDGELVRDITTDPVSLSLVRTIEGVARLMGRRTIAEHVENQAINDAVTEIGCDFMQGFWIGCPVPLDDVLRDK